MAKTTFIFPLTTIKEIQNAEKFKSRLENSGYKLNITTQGFNHIKIVANRKRGF